MDVCNNCGRIIEEGHECSKIIVGREKEIIQMVKESGHSEILESIEKLELKEGDLLLFTYDPSMPQEVTENMIGQVQKFVTEYKENLVPMVILPMNFDLQQMDIDDLRSFRDSAQGLIDKIEAKGKK